MERDLEEQKQESNWEGSRGLEYIKRTNNREPRKQLIRLVEKLEPSSAIELGIGAGNETKFLLEKGWKVLAIDINEKCQSQVISQIDAKQAQNFMFKKQKFETLELEKNSCDLLVAFDSLHFCNKKYFNDFFEKVIGAIRKDGYFIGNLLGVNDSWRKTKEIDMPFFTKEEIIELFKDFEFCTNGLIESEIDGKTAVSEKNKHWHTFFIKAKKK